MSFCKSGLIVLGSVGLLFLGACGNSNQAANSDATSTDAQPAESASSDGAAKNSPLPMPARLTKALKLSSQLPIT